MDSLGNGERSTVDKMRGAKVAKDGVASGSCIRCNGLTIVASSVVL